VRWQWLTGPTALAVIVTLANAAKPVVVDDTAYLTFARHLAHQPLDPYGFEIFWYTAPEPAMDVLLPPVVPYWLALGIHLFGEAPAALKLWLFPFVWLFAWSVSRLLHRFARGAEAVALPLIVLSPAVLPMVNLMLDIPTAALGLAAIVGLIAAVDGRSWGLAVLAGVVAGLAMQTKYTALIVPPILGWYALLHRRLGLGAIAVVAAVATFLAWEGLLFHQYGESHFFHHLAEQQSAEGDGKSPLQTLLDEKTSLVPALAGHLGCLAVGVGLWAGWAVGLPRPALLAAAALWLAGVAAVALLPHSATVLIPGSVGRGPKLILASVVWRTAGAAVLVLEALIAAALLFRFRRRFSRRRSPGSSFVVGWVVLELAVYFLLTPFPAARRLIGLTIAMGILTARFVSRTQRLSRHTPPWIVAFGIAAGVGIAALDTYDAYPEKVLAERAAATIRSQSPDTRIWYAGHWGFQFYCERAGMQPLIPGQSRLDPGDYLVLPLFPDGAGFHRPDSIHTPRRPPDEVLEPVSELFWNDWLSARTIPPFYGGEEPITGRDHPRLRIGIYRVTRAWTAR
jgi:4-amino-4-deoxy-L-arabinose transferase-like glycosyltransferase